MKNLIFSISAQHSLRFSCICLQFRVIYGVRECRLKRNKRLMPVAEPLRITDKPIKNNFKKVRLTSDFTLTLIVKNVYIDLS